MTFRIRDVRVRFAVASLAAWRVTHLISREDGPGAVLARIRARLGTGTAGELMDCFQCLSVWVAVPAAMYVVRRPLDRAVVALAVSGAACLLEAWSSDPVVIRPMPFQEGGSSDGLLRPETRVSANGDH